MTVHYRAVDAAVVRATMRSASGRAEWPDLTSETPEQVRAWRDWLRRCWDDEELAEGIEIASPALAAALREICAGRDTQPRRVRRAAESMISYLLRATTRPTPFGLFAGVSPATLGARATARWGQAPRPVARPDAGWWSALVASLEADRDVLRTLTVTVNNLAFVRGNRLVLPSQPQVDEDGAVSPSEVEVRHSRPVQTVLRMARSPVRVADLAATLASEFPDTPASVIEAMLAQLVAVGMLLTDLRPPMEVTDPLGYLLDRLGAEPSLARSPVLAGLGTLRRTLHSYDAARSAPERRELAAAGSAQMVALHARPGPLLAVDARLDGRIVLPSAVVAEAEAAASALVRLTPQPYGNTAWRSWHGLFLDRYGPGGVVAAIEVVDADRGLGYPAGYRDSPYRHTAPESSARDRALLRLAQRAVLDGSGEVVLDEKALAELAAGETSHRPPHVVPHTELRFRLHAPTTGAVDSGAFTLVVTSAARQAGATLGRFLHLFDQPQHDQISAALTALPTLNSDAVSVQVSCPPLSPRAQNFVRAPALFPLVSLAEHRRPAPTPIPVDDLAVTADAHRLYLVRLSTGQVVEPLILNALEFRHATHPLARFLCEVTTARAATCIPFSWGAAATQPVVPRVRYRRSVLRPACWNLTGPDLPGPRASWADWERAWETLRNTFRIPSAVYLGERDVVLGVNLDEPAHRALLRTHLRRSGTATLTEAPDDTAFGWIGGRPHEISIPMARVEPPLETPPTLRRRVPIRAGRRVEHVPGASAWLYTRLHGHPGRQTELLTVHLPELLATWPHPNPRRAPDMWFLRHHDRARGGEAHLRVRIRLESAEAYGDAARHVGVWADQLRGAGLLNALVLDTYRPETGRYGSGPALIAAEAVFAADSAAAIAQLATAAPGDGPHPQALTAASFIDLATAFLGSRDHGLRWLVEHVPHQGAPPLPRDLRGQIMALADPADAPAAMRALPAAEKLTQAWGRRRHAVQTYRYHVTRSEGLPDDPGPDRVLTALLHLHHARVIGTDPGSERTCLRLARAAALAWAARTGGGHDDHRRSPR
ncbi:lantibiotic dehydratase [Frankia sp. ACN10a]|uniref:lantibiotic dehydratase n=1 Tax=Frankia sp. ACN10a TaxID=2926031 RepID=UPI002117AE59|nr:lantibiotic dehydratase [Frankia sp. ACN10a]